MNGDKVNSDYIDLIMSNSKKYYEDYKQAFEKVSNSTAIYKGKPIPFLAHPMFVTEDELNQFQKIGDMMLSITNKLTKTYLEDSKFRKYFGFSELLEELILVDNGYDINVPIGRFDIFFKDYDNFKFCELNTDGSSAMNEDNQLAKILLETQALKDFGNQYKLNYFELFFSWVDESIKIYNKYTVENKKPNVAIVDFIESATTFEFEEFKKAYEERGYNCIIVDPRDLKYKDGNLYHEDYKIDLVYRRIVTFELIERSEEIKDFIQAYKDKAVCVIGSIRSQIVHNKIVFKILHDDYTLNLLSEEEQDFVKKHVPLTKIFSGDKSVFNQVLNNKEKYIMKPFDLNASRGVYTGRDFSQEEWEEKLLESWSEDYLYQEYCDPYTRDFVVYEDGEAVVKEFKQIIGLFLYNEKLAGLYTRIGENNIISGLTEYYTLPNIKAEQL
jgi:glutathionylspermidine synthase